MTKTKTKIAREGFWERNRKSEGYLLKKKISEILVAVCRFLVAMASLVVEHRLQSV